MNENKKKHTLRNILITLLILCVLGGGGYFGYVKYQEYQEEQAEIARQEAEEKAKEEKLQAEINEALKGVSEEDAAKIPDKSKKSLAWGTSVGQEKVLNNYGILADVNERYGTVNNFVSYWRR